MIHRASLRMRATSNRSRLAANRVKRNNDVSTRLKLAVEIGVSASLALSAIDGDRLVLNASLRMPPIAEHGHILMTAQLSSEQRGQGRRIALTHDDESSRVRLRHARAADRTTRSRTT